MLQAMMTVGRNYSQNYTKFHLNQRVQVTHGTHRGCTGKVVGETLKRVHVFIPEKRKISTLEKSFVESEKIGPNEEKEEMQKVKNEPNEVHEETKCALRLLMGCLERQGIDPSSHVALDIFVNYTEEYKDKMNSNDHNEE